MRRLRTTIGLAVAVCALGAFAAPAFAKEKLIFGEFEASIHGQNLETTPGQLKINKEEGGIEINGLRLGPYTFGRIEQVNVYKEGKLIHERGEQLTEKPCESVKLAPSSIGKEKSSTLTLTLKFSKCWAVAEAGGGAGEERPVSFTLGLAFHSNFSGEVGKEGPSLEIEKGFVAFKGALKKCPVEIPNQTIPSKDNFERSYEEHEIVEYEDESFEPEHIETSKKLKELYPTGEKEVLNILFSEEHFRHIKSYYPHSGTCISTHAKPKINEEPESPYKGMLEFTNGLLNGSIEYLEVKNGNLKFKEAP